MSDNTITIDLSSIGPVSFEWNEGCTSIGLVAQELSTTGAIGAQGAGPMITTGVNLNSVGYVNVTGSNSYTSLAPYEDMELRLAKLEKIIAEEEEIRRSHPAVKTAYDEYRLLMILSKGTPVIPLTE